MSVYKNGIITSPAFYESEGATNLFQSINVPKSYVPSKDTNNSTLGQVAQIRFDQLDFTCNENTIFRVIAKITYSGFDASSTAGSFNIYWQGANYDIASATWKYAGTNYITSSLENGTNHKLKDIVLSSTSGSYIYDDITFSIPSSWFSTYAGSRVNVRTNYSNGVGKISVDDIKLVLDKYSSSSDGHGQLHIGNDFLTGREIIEI